ncbi:MAG: dienelactone hydrolase family protein [Nitrososphaerota archaeon]|nr:dienelactone hydrolase family protein [Nitrososphaerota archaeon]
MVNTLVEFHLNIFLVLDHCFNETRPVYNKEAANDAWESAVSFFNKHLA